MQKVILLALLLFVSGAQHASAQAPAAEGTANLPSQPLGSNDLLTVYVYGAPEISRNVRVSSDGVIRLPMLKQTVKAAGLHPAELEKLVAEALKSEQILVEPFVTISVAEYQSRPISVGGAVNTPLVFQASGSMSLLDALAKAGGLRGDAGSEVLVTLPQRPGSKETLTRRIPVRELIDAADPLLDLQLSGGEKILVPEISKIYVIGNVKLPGAFPVQSHGGKTTLLEVIALAQGLMPFAQKQAYVYRRQESEEKTEIAIPLDKIMSRKAPDFTLQANDIVYIPDNKNKRIALSALAQITSFGTSTATGLLVWRGR